MNLKVQMNWGEQMKKKNKIDKILELPKEIYSNTPKLTITGFNEIIIENYKGIVEYEEFFTSISTYIGIVNINGYNLNLEKMTNDDIKITGKIEDIELERIEDNTEVQMLIKLLTKYIVGYVRICVEGYYIERFINICTTNKILIWNLKRENGVKLYLNIGIKDFYEAIKIIKKLKCRVKIINTKKEKYFFYHY